MGRPDVRPLILIVEDDDLVREFITDALIEQGFNAIAVTMAHYAMEAVQQHRPDLILLDLGMPRGTMQGQDFLAMLRESRAGRSVPVVILSAYGEFLNPDVAGRLGVAAVLNKPLIELSVLVRTVRENLPQAEC